MEKKRAGEKGGVIEGRQKRVEKKKWVKKKSAKGRTPSPFLPRSADGQRFRAGGEAGGMGEPPPPAGRGGDAAAGGGSGRAGRARAAAPSLRLPAPRSARRQAGERREKQQKPFAPGREEQQQ